MEPNQYTAVDFLADDTFHNYYYGSVKTDVVFWENYINKYPEKITEINTAKHMLAMLGAHKLPVKVELANFKDQFYKVESKQSNEDLVVVNSGRKLKTYAFTVCAILVLLIPFFFLIKNQHTKPQLMANEVASVFTTNVAQKKKVTLVDGTSVLLNADSKIVLRKGFNDKTRELDLIGEAYFDVAHNASVPFIVHTAKMNIKVLGTVFNVKAYANEKITETTLITGKIAASINNFKHQEFILAPNEKLTLVNENQSRRPSAKPNEISNEINIAPISLNNNHAVSETVWINNGFEINNETFIELTQKLEREYGVKLVFKDNEVKHYKFTATLKDETITEVLKAMQSVNYFKYKMDNDIVEISK